MGRSLDRIVWKPKHPGVPVEWKSIGEGGNALVWSAGEGAVKRLKPTATREARDRFRRECDLMRALQGRNGLKVVPVNEVRTRENVDEIVMKVMTGNLEAVIDRFRCDPIKAATALGPVVETLALLAEGEPPVHHRDLKPTNLLYLGAETDLYVADFGCAFLGNGERITPDQRALGAWAYRPPEYSGGHVETVTEKGDVFSLGKVFWAMINGEPTVTFPGPIWYLREYDLAAICTAAAGLNEAMYIVGKCCSIRPEGRPTLRDLALMLRRLSDGDSTTTMSLGTHALVREQQDEIEYEQRRAIARPFVLGITEDFEKALVALQDGSPESLTFQAWLEEWRRYPNRAASLVAQVVESESDAPVLNVLRRQKMLNTRFYPEGMYGRLRFFAALGPMNQEGQSPRLTVEALDGGMTARIEGLSDVAEIEPYSPGVLTAFLTRAVEAQ